MPHYPTVQEAAEAVISWLVRAPESASLLAADNPPDVGFCAYYHVPDRETPGEKREISFYALAPANRIGWPEDDPRAQACKSARGRQEMLIHMLAEVKRRKQKPPRNAWERLVDTDEHDFSGVVGRSVGD